VKLETFHIKDVPDNGQCAWFILKVDGKEYVSAGRGELKDNCLNRDLNFVFGISDLLIKVHSLGKEGDTLKVLKKEFDTWDEYEEYTAASRNDTTKESHESN